MGQSQSRSKTGGVRSEYTYDRHEAITAIGQPTMIQISTFEMEMDPSSTDIPSYTRREPPIEIRRFNMPLNTMEPHVISSQQECSGVVLHRVSASSSSAAAAALPPPQKGEVAVGAGLATALVGCIVAGPIMAAAMGCSAIYASRHVSGSVGDAARAVGHVAIAVKNQFVQFNQQHHLVERGQVALAGAYFKIQEIEDEYHFVDRAKDVLEDINSSTASWIHAAGGKAKSAFEWLSTSVSRAKQSMLTKNVERPKAKVY